MTEVYAHPGPQESCAAAALCSSWAHSACDKVDFVSPWQAIQNAEDLAVDVGFCNAIRTDAFVMTKPKCRHVRPSFSDKIDICIFSDYARPLLSFTLSQTVFAAWTSKPWSLNFSHQLSTSFGRTVSSQDVDAFSMMQLHQVQRELPPLERMGLPRLPEDAIAEHANIPLVQLPRPHQLAADAQNDVAADDSSSSSHTTRAVFLYHLDDPVVFGHIDWTDYDCMMSDAARLLGVDVDSLVALYEINVPLADVAADTTPMIAHLDNDMEPGEPSRLCLIDYEMHGNTQEAHYQTAPVVDRRVLITPIPATLPALFIRAGVDVYCHLEDDRCFLFHNHHPVLSQNHPLLRPTHGDYLKLVIPPSLYCDEPTQPLLWRRQQHNELTYGDSPSWSESSGYSPSLVDPADLRAQLGLPDPDASILLQVSAALHIDEVNLAICRRPTLPPPRLEDIVDARCFDHIPSRKLSFTEEFLRAVNAISTAAENLPEFPENMVDIEELAPWTRELYEHWNRHATIGPGAMERLGRLETWYTDHLNYQRCHHTRIAILGPDAHHWEDQIKHLWRQHIIPEAPIEFHLVAPVPEDASGQIIGQLIVVQRPQPFQRSIVLSIYDSAYDRGLAHSLALVMADRIDLLSVMIMAELTEECPPEEAHNECTLWYGARQFAPNERAFARHGHAFRLVLQRASPIPSPAPTTTNLERRMAQLPSSSTMPPFFGPQGAPPPWITELSRAFLEQAAVEREDEGPVAYVTTWYIHAALRPSCVQSRNMRLRDQPQGWQRSIIERWGDHADSTLPMLLFWISPAPPSSLTQGTIGYVLVAQGLPPDQIAVLITTRVRDQEGQAIHHVATFLPAQISAEMVVSAVALPGPLRRFPRRVGHGQTFLAPHVVQPIPSGSSLVVDILGIDPALPSAVPAAADALNLLQTQARRFTRKSTGAPEAIQDARPSTHRVTLSLEACLAAELPYQDFHHAFPETSCWQQPDWPQLLAEVQPSFAMLPDGLNLHSNTYYALAQPEEFLEPLMPGSTVLYVDGSANSLSAAWSVVAVYFDWTGRPSLMGCIADTVRVESTDPCWLGATHFDNIAAELTAVNAAMIACLGLERSSVIIRPDLALSARLATHQWHCAAHPVLSKMCQVLGSWFQRCSGTFREVRGHCGDPWNELADATARHCLNTQQSIGALQMTAFSQLAKSPDLDWAWMLDAPATMHRCLPPGSSDGIWQIQPSLLKVQNPEPAKESTLWHQVSFTCISANVLALGAADPGLEPSSSSDRALRLAHQWGRQKVHIIGLQETRRTAGIYQAGPYKCFASGALQCQRSYHFGCELWLHQDLPLDTNGTLLLRDFRATITYADPRRLLVNLAHDDCQLSFAVLHAPCKTSQCSIDEIQIWWQDTLRLIRATSMAKLTWAFVDANAPLASCSTERIGMAGAEPMNPTGTWFEQAIEELQWYAPTTMPWCHVGSHTTWMHPRGTKARRDYVLCSAAAFSLCARSWVDVHHDGGFGHDDHLPVCLQVGGWIAATRSMPPVQWDSLAFLDPVKCAAFQEALHTLPIPAWPVHVDAHADHFEANLLSLAKQFFSKQTTDRPRPRLAESTCNLIAWKRSCLDYGRKHDLMHDPEFKQQLKFLESDVRRRVHADQRLFYEKLVNQLAAAGDLHDARTVYRTLDRLGARKSKRSIGRALPLLRSEGRTVTSFEQQQRLWLTQFAEVEAGCIMAHSEFRRTLPSTLWLSAAEFDFNAIPTLADLQHQIHRLRRGKAPGPDAVPPDVLKAGGEPLAKQLLVLTSKAATQLENQLHGALVASSHYTRASCPEMILRDTAPSSSTTLPPKCTTRHYANNWSPRGRLC